jgi:hypothetical protein
MWFCERHGGQGHVGGGGLVGDHFPEQKGRMNRCTVGRRTCCGERVTF